MRLPLVLLLFASFAAFAQDTKLYVVTHVDLTPPYIADGTPLLAKFAATGSRALENIDSKKTGRVARQ